MSFESVSAPFSASLPSSAPRARSGKLTLKEVQEAFLPLQNKYTPILFLAQAAELSGYTPLALKKKLSEGCYKDCVSRGNPFCPEFGTARVTRGLAFLPT